MQMQSGTTGINTVRIYNPVKQSHDQDPDGQFIRQWVPELKRVNEEFIHEPWTMTPMEQKMVGCVIGEDYPERIVEHMEPHGLPEQLFMIEKNRENSGRKPNILTRSMAAENRKKGPG